MFPSLKGTLQSLLVAWFVHCSLKFMLKIKAPCYQKRELPDSGLDGDGRLIKRARAAETATDFTSQALVSQTLVMTYGV
jgi:hypothetical protein